MADSVLGLGHIGLPVRDLEKSRAFYTQVLGFRTTCTASLENGTVLCFLRKGDCELELIARPQGSPSLEDGHFEHLCLKVADIEEAVAHLKSHGVDTEGPITELAGVYQGIRLAFFRGPDGECLEFNQFL